jgi:predicted hotdog family 3-hydroxylacyl-ACP dehydratase
MEALHPHGRNQFAVELTAQAMGIAGGGLMHAENGFPLFEQQLDLPTECI